MTPRPMLAGCRPVWYGLQAGRIRPHLTGEFEFDPDGIEAAVVLVPEDGEYIDAVAWALADASCWWVRFGPLPILGRENASFAAAGGSPLIVHSTPERWLLGRGRGVCVLDWKANLLPHLGRVRRLIADSPALALSLNQSLLRGPAGVPSFAPVEYRHVA